MKLSYLCSNWRILFHLVLVFYAIIFSSEWILPVSISSKSFDTHKSPDVALAAVGDSQTATVSSVAKADEAEQTNPLKSTRKTWNGKYFDLTELSGHTDIIRSVDMNDSYIVSAR